MHVLLMKNDGPNKELGSNQTPAEPLRTARHFLCLCFSMFSAILELLIERYRALNTY